MDIGIIFVKVVCIVLMCNIEYPKFSIIIPVYNTKEELLDRCIDSICSQLYSDFEVIIVDDGSVDLCASHIEKICQQYDNFFVYHIPNGGVSNARNFGVSKSRGEWIIFVDSDDVVLNNMLSDINYAISKYPDLDIVYGYIQYLKKYNAEKIEKRLVRPKIEKLSVTGINKLLRHMIALEESSFKNYNGAYVSRGPCARALKKVLAHEHEFSNGIELGEDGIWNIEILKSAPQAAVVNSIWYLYIRNYDSATMRFRDNAIVAEQIYLNKLDVLLGKRKDLRSSILAKTLDSMMNMIINYYIHPRYPYQLVVANKKFKEDIKNVSFSRYSKWKYAVNMSWKHRIKWLILCKNPYPLYLCSMILFISKLRRRD